jgi:hypothetical protein
VRSLHGLFGLLAIVTLVPWHIYNTVLKEWNNSIFTGIMDEKTILRNHPLEYRQILSAVEVFNQFKTENTTTAPQHSVDKLQSIEEPPVND